MLIISEFYHILILANATTQTITFISIQLHSVANVYMQHGASIGKQYEFLRCLFEFETENKSAGHFPLLALRSGVSR